MDDGLPPVEVDDAAQPPDEALHELHNTIDPLQESSRYGIDIYADCLNTVEGLLS